MGEGYVALLAELGCFGVVRYLDLRVTEMFYLMDAFCRCLISDP